MHSTVNRHVIVRPSLPPLAWFAASIWFGAVCAEEAFWRGGWAWTPRLGLELGLAVAAFSVLACVRRLRATAVMAAAGVTAGLIVGALACQSAAASSEALALRPSQPLRVEVLGDPVSGSFGAHSRARVVAPASAAGAGVTVEWPSTGAVPKAGELVRCVGRFTVSAPEDRRRSDLRDGVVGSVRARVVTSLGPARTVRGLFLGLREWARGQLTAVPGSGGDLLAGILAGDRTRLAGTAAEGAFRTSGLTHLVAVSGSHLVVVAALASGLCAAIGMRQGWRSLLVLGLVGAYVVFSGVQVSAVRALVMSAVAFARPLTKRRADSGAALGVTVAGMLLVDPCAAFDLGFQLSVGAVVGLVLFGRLFEEWASAALPVRLSTLGGPLALTLAAQAATLPLIARTFGVVSLVSPVANILVGPLVAMALVIGVLGLVIASMWTWAGLTLLRCAGALCAICASVACRLAQLPYAAVLADRWTFVLTVIGASSLVLLWVWWPRADARRARVAAVSLAFLVFTAALGPGAATSGPTLTVLDVGQGDAILVRDGLSAALIDTGPSASALRAALARFSVRRLEAVLLTHAHADHTAGLAGLDGAVMYGRLWKSAAFGSTAEQGDTPTPDSEVAGRSEDGVAEGSLAAGDTLEIGRWRLDVLWPTRDAEVEQTNDTSLVIVARFGAFTVLLTGDAESAVLDGLAAEGTLPDVDVLKVAHHGSSGGATSQDLATLRPELAIVSVGAGNRFGHPAGETLALLRAAGSRIVRTDQCGDVTISLKGDGARYELTSGRELRLAACETIPADSVWPVHTHVLRSVTSDEVLDGRHRRSEDGLPYLRAPASATRPGTAPPQGALQRGRRPGFQYADLQGRELSRRGHHRSLQHDAVHVRAPPRGRA